jgi:hypothetical protein
MPLLTLCILKLDAAEVESVQNQGLGTVWAVRKGGGLKNLLEFYLR